MTVLAICQNALREISGFDVPNTIVGNQNETAVTALAVLRREGMRLRKFNWDALIVEGVLNTVAGQASYSKPDDFRHFANTSQWDRSNNLRLRGPTTPAEWQFLKGSVTGATATIERWFRVKGKQIFIHPTPSTTDETIAYEYYSTNWVLLQSGSGTAAEITSDNDTTLLDEEALTLGVKWRFLKAKGIPWEAEYREYEDMVQSLLSQNGGSPVVALDKPGFADRLTSVPEHGFGFS